MDRLRSPGGCPWDAEQTHSSLLRYLIEECYELVEAVELGESGRDPRGTRRRPAAGPLSCPDRRRNPRRPTVVSPSTTSRRDLVDKLVRRHPHVFQADAAPVWTAADQQERWDELKKTEQGRSGVLDGVAFGQPAVALAAKLGARAAKFGVTVEPPVGESPAEAMFRIAYAAGARGEDPESALRAVAIAHAKALAPIVSTRPIPVDSPADLRSRPGRHHRPPTARSRPPHFGERFQMGACSARISRFCHWCPSGLTFACGE